MSGMNAVRRLLSQNWQETYEKPDYTNRSGHEGGDFLVMA
jgi:hypothetical protein